MNYILDKKQAAGIFSMAGEEDLDQATADNELWERIIGKEIDFSRNIVRIGCSANIFYVVKNSRTILSAAKMSNSAHTNFNRNEIYWSVTGFIR